MTKEAVTKEEIEEALDLLNDPDSDTDDMVDTARFILKRLLDHSFSRGRQ